MTQARHRFVPRTNGPVQELTARDPAGVTGAATGHNDSIARSPPCPCQVHTEGARETRRPASGLSTGVAGNDVPEDPANEGSTLQV